MKRKAEETVGDTILPTLSGEVKKTKTDISIDEKASSIRDCIKEEENEISGIKEFIKASSSAEHGADFVRSYLTISPECKEIFGLFTSDGRPPPEKLILIWDAFEAILKVTTDSDDSAISPIGSFISNKIIQNHIKMVYSSLSKNSSNQLLQSVLKCLTLMVAQGVHCIKEFLSSFDFSWNGLRIAANKRDRKQKPDPRTCYIRFCLSFFVFGDLTIIKKMLEEKGLAPLLLNEIHQDSKDTIIAVLETLEKRVIMNTKILKKTKLLFFTPFILSKMAVLCKNDDDEIQSAATEFLQKLCTSNEYGICFVDKNAGPYSGKLLNPILLKFSLLIKQQSVTTPQLYDLTIGILKQSPDIIIPYINALNLQMDPRNSTGWNQNVNFLKKLWQSIPSISTITSCKIQKDVLIKLLVPTSIITKPQMMAALTGKDMSAKKSLLELLIIILERCKQAVDFYNSTLDHMTNVEQLIHAIMFNLPEVKTVIAIRQAAITAAEEVKGGDETKEESGDNSIVELSVECLYLYQSIKPGVLTESAFNVCKLLLFHEKADIELLNKSLMILLHENNEDVSTWLEKKMSNAASILHVVLHIMKDRKDHDDVIKNCKKLLIKIVNPTGLFDDHISELHLIFDCLIQATYINQDIDLYIQFADACVKTLRDPFQYIQNMMLPTDLNVANSDEMIPANPLLISIMRNMTTEYVVGGFVEPLLKSILVCKVNPISFLSFLQSEDAAKEKYEKYYTFASKWCKALQIEREFGSANKESTSLDETESQEDQILKVVLKLFHSKNKEKVLKEIISQKDLFSNYFTAIEDITVGNKFTFLSNLLAIVYNATNDLKESNHLTEVLELFLTIYQNMFTEVEALKVEDFIGILLNYDCIFKTLQQNNQTWLSFTISIVQAILSVDRVKTCVGLQQKIIQKANPIQEKQKLKVYQYEIDQSEAKKEKLEIMNFIFIQSKDNVCPSESVIKDKLDKWEANKDKFSQSAAMKFELIQSECILTFSQGIIPYLATEHLTVIFIALSDMVNTVDVSKLEDTVLLKLAETFHYLSTKLNNIYLRPFDYMHLFKQTTQINNNNHLSSIFYSIISLFPSHLNLEDTLHGDVMDEVCKLLHHDYNLHIVLLLLRRLEQLKHDLIFIFKEAWTFGGLKTTLPMVPRLMEIVDKDGNEDIIDLLKRVVVESLSEVDLNVDINSPLKCVLPFMDYSEKRSVLDTLKNNKNINGLMELLSNQIQTNMVDDEVKKFLLESINASITVLTNSKFEADSFKHSIDVLTQALKFCIKHKMKWSTKLLTPIVQPLKEFFIWLLKKKYKESTSMSLLNDFISLFYSSKKFLKITNILELKETYQMMTSHSKFMQVMLTKDMIKERGSIVQLLLTICKSHPDVCNQSLMSVMFVCYEATMSQIDQNILNVIQIHEANNFTVSSPICWGDVAMQQYMKRNENNETLLHENPSTHLINQLDVKKLLKTAFELPLDIKEENSQATDISSLYDPTFLLPLFSTVLQPGCDVDMRYFIDSGCVSLAIACLSLYNDDVRTAAYNVIALVNDQLENSRFKERSQVMYLFMLIKNSIDEEYKRWPTLWSIFVIRYLYILLKPDHPMYSTVNRFILQKPVMNMREFPLFLPLFNSSTMQQHTERTWMLKLLRNGLKDQHDYYLYKKLHVFELLMAYHDSAESDSNVKDLILDVFQIACSIKVAAYDLVKTYTLLSWIHKGALLPVKQYKEFYKMLHILRTSFSTPQVNSEENESSEENKYVIPRMFAYEASLICLHALQNISEFSTEVQFYICSVYIWISNISSYFGDILTWDHSSMLLLSLNTLEKIFSSEEKLNFDIDEVFASALSLYIKRFFNQLEVSNEILTNQSISWKKIYTIAKKNDYNLVLKLYEHENIENLSNKLLRLQMLESK